MSYKIPSKNPELTNTVKSYLAVHPSMKSRTLARLISKDTKGKFGVEQVRKSIGGQRNAMGDKKRLQQRDNNSATIWEQINNSKTTQFEEKDNTSVVSGKINSKQTDRVKILEEFLQETKVDLNIWQVDRYIINKWDVTMKNDEKQGQCYTNYQIKVWLVKKTYSEIGIETLVERLLKSPIKVPTYARAWKKPEYLYEVALYDQHLGKFAWAIETGENYDLKIAKDLFLKAIDKFEDHAKIYNPEKILFPIGNDFLHVVNEMNTTVAGTPQDVEGRFPKIVNYAIDTLVCSIEKFRKIAPIHIVLIMDNHSGTASYMLAKVLEAYYRNCKDVTFDIRPKTRKCFTWGKCFIGFEHGELKPEKCVNNIKDEFMQEWAATEHHEVHTGHLHIKKETNFLSVNTFGQCIHRHLASLSRTDAWHYKNGYLGKKAADSFIWDKNNGMISNFSLYL